VLCQLGATAPFRRLAEEWQPGFADGRSDHSVEDGAERPEP